MVTFNLAGTYTAGTDLAGISDLDVLFVDGGWHLYATTRQVPGISVLDLDLTSPGLSMSQRLPFSGATGLPDNAVLIQRDSDWALGLTGQDATGHGGRNIAANGNVTGALDMTPTTGSQASLTDGTVMTLGGETYLFAGQYGSGTLTTFRVLADFRLERQAAVTLGDGQANAVASVHVNGQSYVFAASGTQAAIDTYLAGPDGSLTLVSPGGPETDIGLQAVRQLETVTLDGVAYLIAGSHGANALTVFEVLDSGNLISRDHVIEDLGTRFDALGELAVTTHRGRVFVAAAGADDGVSLFEMVPGGYLLHLQTFADALNTTLDNVSGLVLAAEGDTLSLVVSSDTEAGLTLFTADLGAPGLAASGTKGADTLTGGTNNDRIAGLDGHDVLIGNAGDDILIDGRGRDTMTGGSGADRFVLTGDYQTDTILDYDRSKDSLDLSGWEYLRYHTQITFSPTATGITLTFGDEVLVIHSGDGQTLTQADFDLDGLITATHALFEGPAFLPVVTGTEGSNDIKGNEADNLIEALGGDDTLNGREGADTLDGGMGIDLADYSRAKTSVVVDMSDLSLNQGEAAGDTFLGIEGLSGSKYADILRADETDNILCGREGDDELRGRKGKDHLMGDEGNDRLFGGRSGDRIEGGIGDDLIRGEQGHDNLRGGKGNDTIAADQDRDRISAGRGHDKADGGSGDDRIDGGRGNDTLTGGIGADTFVFASGRDVITDFRNDVDTIRLDATLWGGAAYTAQQVLDLFAIDTGTDMLLDFGNNTQLTILGLNHVSGLLDDLVF